MDCKPYVFDVSLNVMVQPGNYPMKIKYKYIGETFVRVQPVGQLNVLREYTVDVFEVISC